MGYGNIAIYGAGLIGCGWVTHYILHEPGRLTVYDLTEEILQRARERILDDLRFLWENGAIGRADAEERLGRVRFTTDPSEALKEADLVQENCPENIDLKRKCAVEIESMCPAGAVIATSTSGIRVTDISSEMSRPERMVGAHPYHPVYLLPLVELAGGERTDREILKQLSAFYRGTGKVPVVLKKECPGYIASRLMSVLFRESTHLIQSGVADMEDIDDAFTYGPGMRYGLVGINLTLQLAGGDRGLAGTLFGGIGTSGGNWMETFANFTSWPEDYLPFWQTCQMQMDKEMRERDDLHGRTNEEIARFRDRGLIELLRIHGLMGTK